MIEPVRSEPASERLVGTVWKPKWWVYLFPMSLAGRVRVAHIQRSRVDGKPLAAVCVNDSGEYVTVALTKRNDGLWGFRQVGA